MRPLYFVPLGTDFIDETAAFILRDGRPLHRIAVVFPGKRPALYLRRRLAELLNKPFYAPAFFSMEAFIDHTASGTHPDFTDVEYHDAIWLLYKAILSIDSGPFREDGFDRFYYWGRHLFSFIDQMDTENIPDERLRALEKNAEVGYDVPESVNDLLLNISLLRRRFHAVLERERVFTRGSKYLAALKGMESFDPGQFDHIYFVGFFGLTGVEKAITRSLWERGLSTMLFEGDPGDWPILEQTVSFFGAEVERIDAKKGPLQEVALYSGLDTHGEVLKVFDILTGADQGKTAIILPRSEALLPLLTFAVDHVDTPYNISLGYPLMRTPVFDLIFNLVESRMTQRGSDLYPARTYLRVVLHPFVKNLTVDENLRTVLTTLERLLTGEVPGSPVAGKAYVTLDEMERAARDYFEKKDGRSGLPAGALAPLKEIHRRFFSSFDRVRTLHAYAEEIEETLDFVLAHTPVRSYVLSGEIFTRTFELLDRIKGMRFSKEVFGKEEKENRRILGDFILQFLKSATLPFETRPVEPLEILGVLESRSVRFDTVIMLDVNEGVMPQPRKVDPLVPIGVYDKLGIPSPEYNEEIYRYYFRRLVGSARNVHLLYIDAEDKPRSRYIEQIIWEKEKEGKTLDIVKVRSASLPIRLRPRDQVPGIRKTEEVWRRLTEATYSPSCLDDYLRCPVSFYFRRLLGFEERREVTEDVDARERGEIIHRILLDTFTIYKDREIGPSLAGAMAVTLADVVKREFLHRVITGEFYLFERLASFKLEAFIRKNVGEAAMPFMVKYLEKSFEATLPVNGLSVRFKGRIDRIDYSPSTDEYTIIDYKTGGGRQYPGTVVSRVDFGSIEYIHRYIPTFQLPLYIHCFRETLENPFQKVNGKVIFLKNNQEEPLFKRDDPEERAMVQEKYMEGVATVLRDILDPGKAFRPFDDLSCSTCAFRLLCHV